MTRSTRVRCSLEKEKKGRYVKLGFMGQQPHLEIYEDSEPVDILEIGEYVKKRGKKLSTREVRFLIRTYAPLMTREELFAILQYWDKYPQLVKEARKVYGDSSPGTIIKVAMRRLGIYGIHFDKKKKQVYIGRNVTGWSQTYVTTDEDWEDVRRYIRTAHEVGFNTHSAAGDTLYAYLAYLKEKRLPADSLSLQDDFPGVDARALKFYARLLGKDAELIRARRGDKITSLYVLVDPETDKRWVDVEFKKEDFERAPFYKWLQRIRRIIVERNPFNL